jgi:hypothetical protein
LLDHRDTPGLRQHPARRRLLWPLSILAAGFAVRLILASLAPHPGVADPNHYYNLAQSLRAGRGFAIDYIWQYHTPPADVTHPIDHWMPLTAVWPAASQTVFGDSLLAALLPSVVAGSLLPLLAYHFAGLLDGAREGRLFALAATACVPELILNSVRTDTTIFYACFVGLALVALYYGMTRRPAFLAFGGVCAGLAHLTRQDGLLLAVVFLLYLLVCRDQVRWRYLWLFPAAWLVVMAPWLVRNMLVLGEIMPSGAVRSMFLTTLIDQYSYARQFSLQTYLDWGIGNIVGKWAFEGAASIRLVYTLPGAVLTAAGALGLGELILVKRDRQRLRLLAAPLIALGVVFGFYTFITPFLSQGGSFKKSYMALIPFLIALGAVTVERHIALRRARLALMALTCAMMLLDGLVLVRNDFSLASVHLNNMRAVKAALNAAGDINGDGEIIVMTEDPFMLNYVGFRALMTPNDDLETTLAVAERYRVDYIIMPTAREALAPIYMGEQADPRLTLALGVPGPRLELYRVNIEPTD